MGGFYFAGTPGQVVQHLVRPINSDYHNNFRVQLLVTLGGILISTKKLQKAPA